MCMRMMKIPSSPEVSACKLHKSTKLQSYKCYKTVIQQQPARTEKQDPQNTEHSKNNSHIARNILMIY